MEYGITKQLPPLYKRDSKGKIRELTIEIGYDDAWSAGTRSTAGILNGKLVTSGWKESSPKNVGKSNATSALTQAEAEAQANWDKKSEKEYFTDINLVDTYEKFKPMLAGDYTKQRVQVTSGYSQPKLDGIRCVANSSGLWTRAGKAITSCPHIWSAVKPILDANPTMTLDGELYNQELKDDFNKITSLVRKLKSTDEDIEESKNLVQYHVYDLQDSRSPNDSFSIRSAVIDHVINSNCLYLKKVPTSLAVDQEELDELYANYMTDGYEGQMVRQNTRYENKRSNGLLKRKQFITEEFPVVTMLEGQGNWAGHVKKFALVLPSGETCGAGVRGTQEVLKKLWETGESPTWATLRYFGLTPDGVPRFPVVIDYGYGERSD
jgi:DNA ligase-1